ncbi:family 2 glycoside hydrolase [Xylaria bambusicola]|uniref:family 2 glycoside hydrolase n=1 Tax=Xylaria bambusicola TaxID=326684 RepID=UPI0020074D78|nr:family 2 glycoside hydrolase [Xylaria bambusicola]KAI0516852.1 family 2 glycoside hydrolase [Xylaria bambusicola]
MRGYEVLGLLLGLGGASATSLHSKPGYPAIIPSWDIQSSAKAGTDLNALSKIGADTSSWHRIDSSRCTLTGCLLQVGVYNEEDWFYSENLKSVDADQFRVPWLYRNEFNLDLTPGKHYFLQTHGITSKADIFINGKQIANNLTQAGAYAGHKYDVSGILDNHNALVVRVYPTNYNYDLALGFVDWNPYPPDNGTGVWRDIELKQTGPVALDTLRVITETDLPSNNSTAHVTLKSTAQNLESHEVTVELNGNITSECGQSYTWNQTVTLGALQSKELVLSTALKKPKIWWPRQWGKQPLYTGQLSVSVNDELSDVVDAKFGIRKVTSKVNSHNDTIFYVNGLPFQVLGGGYSADMFLRWDSEKFTQQAQLTLDLGGNTIRLEGKNEHPELYEIADKLGLMVLAGWECCDKWEAWSFNPDLAVKVEWVEKDYVIANASVKHEISMQQNHPSMLGFLVGSDYWPDDRAAEIYHSAFKESGWQIPVIASASKRSYPKIFGPSGMKMDGPYDWVPPNYWYNVEPSEDRLGAAFGFGSELGAGVGTPEISSLKKFLSKEDMDDLWKKPNKGLYHMSTNVSSFYDRKIYNDGLWARYGAPTSLEDYLLKAQMMDYEATRSQFESVSAFWNKERPATGLIYWMLNNAWPSLHWNLFDYYLHPAGSYFGAKAGSRLEHVAYDYLKKSVYLINHSIDKNGSRILSVDVIDKNGKSLYSATKTVETKPNTSRNVLDITKPMKTTTDVVFLRITLATADQKTVLSRNVYWLAKDLDILDWEDSDWFFTPVTRYANYTALNKLQSAEVSVSTSAAKGKKQGATIILENKSSVPAVFVSLNLVDKDGKDVLPVFWSDNYVTLWPHEKLELKAEGSGAAAVEVKGKNVQSAKVSI